MENIHANHRQRMKTRFRENGLDGFSDHEVLEILLYFAVPRVNTNETAHLLLQRFGTLSGVFEAGYDELRKVKNVGDASAVLLSLISPLSRRYELDRVRTRKTYATVDEVGRFLLTHYIGSTRERVELLLFDAKFRMTDIVTLHEGAVNSSDINPEKVAEEVFSHRASSFILAHNHPGGSCVPSETDLHVTYEIYKSFMNFNIVMRDHILVAGNEYCGILAKSLENAGIRQIKS